MALEVDAELARGLILDQMPMLLPAEPLRPVAGGTDSAIFRLGPAHAARFPLRPEAAAQVTREAEWLPRIGAAISLDVPRVRAVGAPGRDYPHPWCIFDWVAGEDALAEPPISQHDAAETLADLIGELRGIDGAGLPAAGTLEEIDAFAREMIAAFRPEEGEPDRLLRLWEGVRALPDWRGAPVTVHADLHALNIVVQGGRIGGVIDWGALSRGDPARDLLCGWALLDATGRAHLRERLAPDPDTWARGRGWAFAKAVMAIPYYRGTGARFRALMVRTLAECLSEMDPTGN